MFEELGTLSKWFDVIFDDEGGWRRNENETTIIVIAQETQEQQQQRGINFFLYLSILDFVIRSPFNWDLMLIKLNMSMSSLDFRLGILKSFNSRWDEFNSRGRQRRTWAIRLFRLKVQVSFIWKSKSIEIEVIIKLRNFDGEEIKDKLKFCKFESVERKLITKIFESWSFPTWVDSQALCRSCNYDVDQLTSWRGWSRKSHKNKTEKKKSCRMPWKITLIFQFIKDKLFDLITVEQSEWNEMKMFIIVGEFFFFSLNNFVCANMKVCL